MAAALRVGILAGESSGDILGAGLMQALRERRPDIEFRGIGGPLMEAQGLRSRVPMERLSVMGLVEPLKRLPELLRIRRELVDDFTRDPPDVFIGIDSPDFNLGVEERLRRRGIKTVHYVSPSVWAWRQGRIHKIARACDLVLALLPFETPIYEQHGVRVRFVGHPLADLIPLEPDRAAARRELSLAATAPVLALLPGSRQGEVARLAPVFLATASRLLQADPQLQVLLPCASPARRQQLQPMVAEAGIDSARLHLIDGSSRTAMTAADAVVLASGTAALEAMLLKRPMLVCYRMAPLSYWIISRMLKVPHFSLPNLLPRIQHLLQPGSHALLQQRYLQLHQQLRCDASNRAAEAVLEIL
jgi:lipid-A-disaccharide synthase